MLNTSNKANSGGGEKSSDESAGVISDETST